MSSEPFHHELSAHSDTLTQQSPHKQRSHHRNMSPSHPIHSQNIQIQYMRLKEQTRRELESCYQEINILKEELYRKNEEIQNLQDNIIIKLRQQLNQARRNNIKFCQGEERVKKQLEKMRKDNQSLVIEIDRVNKERKTYYEKLDGINHMHEEMKKQLQKKQKNYKKYFDKAILYEKQIESLKNEVDDLKCELRERERLQYDQENSYKDILQRNFTFQNQLRAYQIKNKDQELILGNYHKRITQYEKDREQLLDKIDELQRDNEIVRSRIQERQKQHEREERQSLGSSEKTLLIQIQSLITQVSQVLDRKVEDKTKADSLGLKFKASIQCLQRTLRLNL